MGTKPYLIGVDVASEKADIDVHGPNDEELGRFVMRATNSHMREVLQKLQNLVDKRNTVVILEATAVYHRIYYYAFLNCGFQVVVVNPYQAHAFQRALKLRKTRTDKISAHSLAITYRAVQSGLISKTDDRIELRKLVRLYYHFVDQQSAYRRRILLVLVELFPLFARRFPNPFSQTALALLRRYPTPQAVLDEDHRTLFQFLKSTSRQRSQWVVDKLDQLLKIARQSPSVPNAVETNICLLNHYLDMLDYLQRQASKIRRRLEYVALRDHQVRLLLTIPGIGVLLATAIVAEIDRIENFPKPVQLVAFAGIDPSVRESGLFKGSRNHMSKRGSKLLRRALYLAAVCAIQRNRTGLPRNPYLREYYERKIQQGKPKKVALGACMRKMACYIFATLKHNEPFTLVDPAQAQWRKAA